MYTIKTLKELKKKDNNWIVQVEWESYSGSDTWEPIKDIMNQAKEDVVRLLKNYKGKENLPKYLTKFLEKNSSSKQKRPSKKQKFDSTKQTDPSKTTIKNVAKSISEENLVSGYLTILLLVLYH